MRIRIARVLGALLLLLARGAAGPSRVDATRPGDELGDIPAITAHEEQLSKSLFEALKEFKPKTDNLGNIFVSVGNGAPHRLIATAMDEPGYVVSEITSDGFLRVQRLPQAPPNPVFDAVHFAQPVNVITRSGKHVPGVFAGLSVHLQAGRLSPPKMNHVEELYVDIGARNTEEVRTAGVDLLDPVAPLQRVVTVGKAARSGPGAAEQVGCERLYRLARRIQESKASGTTTIAFVTQQWLGGRGLNRLLTQIHPDEMVLVGRITPISTNDNEGHKEQPKPGSGLLLGVPANSAETPDSLEGRLKALAGKKHIPVQVVTAAPIRLASYAKGATLPDRFVQVGLPILWPVTPAETISLDDEGSLQKLLEAYLELPSSGGLGGDVGAGHAETSLEALTEAYGASGHEEAVRKVVLNRLPEWAQKKATTDAAGNLVLRVGGGRRDDKTPRIVIMAHMDEIGFEVKKIEDDGRLQGDALGGGYPQYFFGHVALVHKKDGSTVGGVMELPSGWEKPGFAFSSEPRSINEPGHVFVATKTKAETEKLGIAVGDYVTIPKQYRPLLGTRANARSFDDRVGCAALVTAVRALGPDLPGRDVTLVWSTEEEVGLKGAAAFAEQAAKEGRVPDFVFAIDTFVSSDSPLESKRFGDAELGKGFVVRAVDNSNIVPLQYMDRVVALAKEANIPAQYGVTGGGNDGAVFTRFGSVDVALGWPLRYSHSPGEVIDTKDLDALGRIVEVLARKW